MHSVHRELCALCTVQAEAEESLFLQLAAELLCCCAAVPASAELQIRPPGVTKASHSQQSLAEASQLVPSCARCESVNYYKAGLVIQLVSFYESKSV